jgi:hypothetical protein
MNAEGLERRVEWGQRLAWLLVAATAWCVRLEFTVRELKTEMETLHAKRDEVIKTMWEKMGSDHDRLIGAEKDIEWIKKEKR